MSSDFADPYLDPRTGVLRNLVGAETHDELYNAEGELVSVRTGEFLEKLPRRVTGSLDDIRLIHKWLFQDIYDWAGEIRTVEIRKNVEGSEFFLQSASIVTGIEWSHRELVKDKMLRDLSIEQFVERLSYHYDNYNYIHPFREGNGRTQRLMWTLICHDAGYDLDWRRVSGEENDEASRLAAERLDYGMLTDIFMRIASPCDPRIPINRELVAANHLSSK